MEHSVNNNNESSASILPMETESNFRCHEQVAAHKMPGFKATVSSSAWSARAFVLPKRWSYLLAKRLMDVSVSIILLLCTFPILFVISLLIKITSPGPVLYRQKRLGLGGRHFWCLKFRTMVTNAEDILTRDPELRERHLREGFKLKNDPRITWIGKFLRKTSLDEFPQLLNVLVGELSLIGPRPIVPAEIACYGNYAEKLLTAKPGLGGLWQASGRSDIIYSERVALDMHYIDHQSLGFDIVLLFQTASSICRSRGAY